MHIYISREVISISKSRFYFFCGQYTIGFGPPNCLAASIDWSAGCHLNGFNYVVHTSQSVRAGTDADLGPAFKVLSDPNRIAMNRHKSPESSKSISTPPAEDRVLWRAMDRRRLGMWIWMATGIKYTNKSILITVRWTCLGRSTEGTTSRTLNKCIYSEAVLIGRRRRDESMVYKLY